MSNEEGAERLSFEICPFDDIIGVELAVLLGVGEGLIEWFEFVSDAFFEQGLGVGSEVFAVFEGSDVFALIQGVDFFDFEQSIYFVELVVSFVDIFMVIFFLDEHIPQSSLHKFAIIIIIR